MTWNSYIIDRYSYARNCPLMYSDPTGQLIWELDRNGNLIMENGDNEHSLAKFLNTTSEAAMQLLTTQGYINEGKFNMNVGDVLKLDNVFTRNLLAHGNLPNRHPDLDYNCWGASSDAGANGQGIENGVGIKYPVTFDWKLQNQYSSIAAEDAVFGQTVLRFTTDNPFAESQYNQHVKGNWVSRDPDAIGGALHGATFYGRSNDGTVYVHTKNGWETAPKIMRLSDVERIYGPVRGLNGQSGYYLKLH